MSEEAVEPDVESLSAGEVTGRALALAAAGKYEEACVYFELLEPTKRHDAEFLIRYGAALACAGHHAWAKERMLQALALEPMAPEAHSILGMCYGFLGDLDRSREHYDLALAYGPDMPCAHWNRSMHRLETGDFLEGFAEYEWGRVLGMRPTRNVKPQWDGRYLGWDKTLYVWSEQGYGDTIQFMRLLKEARVRSGARIVFECQTMLLPLIYDHPYADTVVAQEPHGAFRHPYDEHVALMSLPYVFGWASPADVPTFEPYLWPRCKAAEFGDADGRKKVGICWRGSKTHSNDRARSLELANIEPLLTLPECVFVSLQKDFEIPEGLALSKADLNDWSETAAVVDAMDVIVTVDTAVAHLAGAMGKPVLLMLSYDNDWRWGTRDKTTTPWYPSVTLFHQKALGEWGPVVEEVREQLTMALVGPGGTLSPMDNGQWTTRIPDRSDASDLSDGTKFCGWPKPGMLSRITSETPSHRWANSIGGR